MRTRAPKIQLSTRVPQPLYGKLKTYATVNRLTIEEIVEESLDDFLKKVDPGGRLKGAVLTRLTDAQRLDSLEAKIDRLADIALGAVEKGRAGKP